MNVQVTEEAFSSQSRPSNTSKHELLKKISTFVGNFCPPGSGSGSGSRLNPDPIRIRIRIRNPDFNAIPLKQASLWVTGLGCQYLKKKNVHSCTALKEIRLFFKF
jgi:hypothetical protein